MVNYARALKRTSQSQPIFGREKDMEKNSAGGYAFTVKDPMQRLRRFLILGSEDGTYYIDEQKLVKQNHASLIEALDSLGVEVVAEIIRISDGGLAPKNKPALFALAVCASYKALEVRRAAIAAVPKVARTGADLMYFVSQAQELRGWGRALKRAISNWFESKNIDQLVNNAIKYRQREGWTMADLLRLAHPQLTGDKSRVAKWIVDGVIEGNEGDSLERLWMADKMINVGEAMLIQDLAEMIVKWKLPREVVPTNRLNDVKIWEALADDMPIHAMVRNLGKMTSIDLLKPLGEYTKKVTDALRDQTKIQKSRMHPFALMMAQFVYQSGHGMRGSLSWQPVPEIVHALTEAFELSFKSAERIKGRTLVAIDVSGSMGVTVNGGPVSCSEAACAVALTINGLCDNAFVLPFADKPFHPLQIGPRSTMKQIGTALSGMSGGTDCASPFLWCEVNETYPDNIVILTDNETWSGERHASEVLEKLRKRAGHPIRFINMPMAANHVSVSDYHPDNLEIVGLDASAVKLAGDFFNGAI